MQRFIKIEKVENLGIIWAKFFKHEWKQDLILKLKHRELKCNNKPVEIK